MTPPAHPASERAAGLFHAVLAGYYLLGAWFHLVSAWRHVTAWRRGAG